MNLKSLILILLTIFVILPEVNLEEEIEGYAVIIEVNNFAGEVQDLNTDFADSKRLQNLLKNLGFENFYVIEDSVTPEKLEAAFEFLEKASKEDLVFFYIGTHGGFKEENHLLLLSDGDKNWKLYDFEFTELFSRIKSKKSVVMIASCNAGGFVYPDLSGMTAISLAAVDAPEYAWGGLPEEGLPIIGMVFTYYFVESYQNSNADLNGNGFVSVEEAFEFSTPLIREYMADVVFKAFSDEYPPEDYFNLYNPHPLINDEYEGEFYLQEVLMREEAKALLQEGEELFNSRKYEDVKSHYERVILIFSELQEFERVKEIQERVLEIENLEREESVGIGFNVLGCIFLIYIARKLT
ncbi:MAG: caspase family protein [Candidatus Methanofastidiosia archaeon]